MAHEGEAKIAQAVLFDAWISHPCVSVLVGVASFVGG